MNLIVLIVIGLLKTIITTSSNISISTENVSTDEMINIDPQNVTNNKQSDINYYNETILNNQNNMTTITISNNIQNVNEYLTTKANTVNVSDMNFIFADQNYTSLNSMLNFFNTELLIKHFDQVKNVIGQQCKENLEEYIEGLLRNELWALKMDDSNGRYSGGLLWGNNFWTGSQVQCLEIIPNFAKSQYRLRSIFVPALVQKMSSDNVVENFQNDTNSNSNTEDTTKDSRLKRNSKIVSNVLNTDLTLYNTNVDKHVNNKMESHESWPTFLPSYFTMKIDIYELPDTIGKKRRVQMGVCMPNTCSDSDIKAIVEKIASNRQSVNIVVTKIRSHHQYYNIWKDKLFWALTFITAVVCLVILAGTIYDYHLFSLKEEKETIVTNISSNGNARTVSQIEKHITLDIDKSGRYVVNNNYAGSNFRNKLENYILDILLAFSVRRNLSIICNKSVGSDTLPTIHGLRAISMAWVILGHTCIIVFKYSDNMEFRKVVEEEFLFQTITNGVYSVDTFFFISGLLVSFLYFRTNAKGTLDYLTKGATKLQTALLHFLGLIAYRFARLTVPYIYVMGVVTICMKWYHYNSIFEPPTLDHVNCPDYWWRNILYINTYFPVEEMCMLWSWYLSNDTQFFIVGSICLILALSHLKLASILLFLLLISSWITTIYIAFVNNYIPNTDDPLALFDKIYDKPWTRFGPYLIGMLTGYFLFKVDCQIRFSKFTVALGWLLSCSCLMFLIYGPYGITFSSYTGALFSAMSHSIWAISLSWIVIACSTGYGGWANKILSSTILYPFSRVTYCAYLIHPLSIRYMIMQMDSPLHLGKDLMTTIYFGQVVVSYALSFVISLAFEAPIVSTLRILSSKKPREKQ